MSTRSFFAALLLGCGLFGASPVSAGSVYLELNGAKADQKTGAEVGAGYQLSLGPARFTPIIGGFIYSGDTWPYEEETFNNGNTICRDQRNGRFSDDENCDGRKIKLYGKAEVTVQIFDKFQIGGGARFGEETNFYGTAYYQMTNLVAFKGFGGKNYYGGGLALVF